MKKKQKTSLEDLIQNVRDRQEMLRADKHIHNIDLRDNDPREMIIYSFGHLIKGLERKATLVDLSVTLGKRIRQKFKLRRDSVAACHNGWFILISFLENGLIDYELKHKKTKRGKTSKYQAYQLKIKNKAILLSLWDEIYEEEEVDMFPTNSPPSDWESGTHSTGAGLIKKASSDILRHFNTEDHTYLFETLNKLNNTAWCINRPVFEVYSRFLEQNIRPSPFKHTRERDKERRESYMIEASAINKLAEKHSNSNFYHLYNCDFRGRIYSCTAFLHEQGSDNAKGLLMMADAKPLGPDGFYWLCLFTANSHGFDKETLDNRVQYTLDHYQEFLDYARDPYTNTGWIEADKPWTFLACCYELLLLEGWTLAGEAPEDFVSGLPIYLDGSNNGIQHLTAISLDEEMAPYCNLTPSEAPGDIYALIAEKLWERLTYLESQLDSEIRARFDEVFDEGVRLQRIYNDAPRGSEKKAMAYAEVQTWRNNNRKLREQLMPVYWCRITDLKERRKIVKRGVMTVPYGATSYGMGAQIYTDSTAISPFLAKQEVLWAVQLGTLLHETCYEELKKPASYLRYFESIAEEFNEKQEYLQWTSSITNFPVIQNYRKPVSQRTKLKYNTLEFYVTVENWDDSTLHKDRQRQGSSPNIVHSFDAVHLSTVVHDAEFKVTVVHDSFGSVAADTGRLFDLVRLKFVEFYKLDPLENMLKQMNTALPPPKKGGLRLESVLDSDFAFV